MADPRSPLGPVLPPHMLGQASGFTVPQAEQANVLSALLSALEQRLQGPVALQQQAVADQTAMAQAAGQSVAEWWVDPAVQAWAAPFIDNPSRLIGALVAGQNPLAGDRSAATLDAPTVSEALLARGVHPALAAGAELFVPDPTGAGKVADLLPLLGVVPFLRTLRSRPEAAARATAALTRPQGSRGFFEDLEAVMHGVHRGDGNYSVFGGRAIREGADGSDLGSIAPSGATSQMDIKYMDDNNVFVDVLMDTGDNSNGIRDLLLPVLDFADAHGVTVHGYAHGFTDRIDTSELIDMYRKAGFVSENPSRPDRLIRRPVPTEPQAREAEMAQRALLNTPINSPSGLGPESTEVIDRVLRQSGMSPQEIAEEHRRIARQYRGRDWDDIHDELEATDPFGIKVDGYAFGDSDTNWTHWEQLADDVFALSQSPIAETWFPLTELGQPAIPTLENLDRLAATDSDSVAAWMRAWGVSEEAADDVAFVTEHIRDDDAIIKMLREAYATIEDPDVASELLGTLDAFEGVTTPNPRLYPERDLSNLRPSSFDEVRQGVEDTIRNLESGDDSWLGRSGGG